MPHRIIDNSFHVINATNLVYYIIIRKIYERIQSQKQYLYLYIYMGGALKNTNCPGSKRDHGQLIQAAMFCVGIQS